MWMWQGQVVGDALTRWMVWNLGARLGHCVRNATRVTTEGEGERKAGVCRRRTGRQLMKAPPALKVGKATKALEPEPDYHYDIFHWHVLNCFTNGNGLVGLAPQSELTSSLLYACYTENTTATPSSAPSPARCLSPSPPSRPHRAPSQRPPPRRSPDGCARALRNRSGRLAGPGAPRMFIYLHTSVVKNSLLPHGFCHGAQPKAA